MKYEYMCIKVDANRVPEDIAERANEQGRNGFRVVSILMTPNFNVIITMEKAVEET